MRTIRILAYPGANLLDISGPAQVFASASHYAIANGYADQPSYDVSIVSLAGGPIATTAGVALETAKAKPEPVDTLLVAGGFGAETVMHDEALMKWIRSQALLARRTGSICTGAFLLAKAGLLKGRKATTHWNHCAEFARLFPDVTINADALYVEDRKVWTSAGVLAGVDLALAMVERDMGQLVANVTARALVAAAHRAQGEPQISPQLIAQQSEAGRIRRLMEWIAANPAKDLSPAALAKRAALSKRSLHRHFQSEVGQTPAEFVERSRVAAARRLLTRTDRGVEQIADAVGFGSLSTMRRAFIRVVGVTPAQFRRGLARG
jgi:transcriptional regulator GlxA family with amidase domain